TIFLSCSNGNRRKTSRPKIRRDRLRFIDGRPCDRLRALRAVSSEQKTKICIRELKQYVNFYR
ncbi:MAG: hypothetical protein PVH35_05135, partial [Syntrophobacterales bacterium]